MTPMRDLAMAQRADATGGEATEQLRAVHLSMVEAVLNGDGLQRVAELAAGAVGGAVAIVVPRYDIAVAAPADSAATAAMDGLRRHAAAPPERPVARPEEVTCAVPISSGAEVLGLVALVGEAAEPDAAPLLQLAALAALTDVAVEQARDEVEQTVRGSFIEQLRGAEEVDREEVVRRAGRLGCELADGVIVLCAEVTTNRPRHVAAMITEDYPGALAQHLDGRIYALLPALSSDASVEPSLAAARRLAARLQRHGTVGVSGFYADPGELPRAIQEAELVVEVVAQSDGGMAEDVGHGTYRLLFRVLASHPEEVRTFYEDTVAPIVRYDEQYRTDLVGTLEAYLGQNCNMNATAATIFAHRHTVAYRLERVKELTGLDPQRAEDRERLGLGLKSYRVMAPRLPR